MSWDTVQQLIRIVAYAGGSYWFGESFADGDTYQAVIGALVTLGAFAWWIVKERSNVSS